METIRFANLDPSLKLALYQIEQIIDKEISTILSEKVLEDDESNDFSDAAEEESPEEDTGESQNSGFVTKAANNGRFTSSWAKPSNVDLMQVNLDYENGIAKCPKEILEKGENEWKDYIVGFFIRKRLPYPIVKATLARQWKLKGNYDMATDDDYFYFKFSNDEDKRTIMEKGPLFIAGRFFVVKPWDNEIEAQRLADMKYSGNRFTWKNKVDGMARITSKIDRLKLGWTNVDVITTVRNFFRAGRMLGAANTTTIALV
ncbi:hypothetical protein FRX31_018418 [Thalictrum thalictroides]|uniref:DUF4283 domain-containing protein n=1 Tax=Thalictrum thalictroides TaxID=46969 RepID=A0A7J6W3P2_THATH|nr:hypothetical protein FRX31_018418 [Thalictrum thalictroides]